MVLAGFVLLGYNQLRFDNILDNGYVTSNNWVSSNGDFRYEMLNYGLFDIRNIPTNLYYYFLNVPFPVLETRPNFYREIFKTDTNMIIHLVSPYIKVKTPGVSFFVVSPLFLFMFRNKFKTLTSKLALGTSLFILMFLLTYYWSGWTQIGPRYMIDLLPFLYILLLESFKKREITLFQKILISLSALFNIFLFNSVFG